MESQRINSIQKTLYWKVNSNKELKVMHYHYLVVHPHFFPLVLTVSADL